jgi:hypothetical protein
VSAWRPLCERVFGIDRRALAAVRIGLALALLLDLSLRARSLTAMVTDMGVLPRSLMDPWMRETIAPLHMLSGSLSYQVGLHLLAYASALLLLVGRFTRVVAVVSWILLVSLQARNPLVLNFGDAVLRVCLFWALFLPLGSRWSLDAARASAPDPRPVCSVASAGFLLQVCFLYFFTAVAKSGPDWHESGLALYYALQLDWLALPPALWLRDQLLATKLLTWATLVFEYVGPFLLLMPLWPIRVFAVLGFWALHLGISATLRLGLFPWIDITVLAAFLPRQVWDTLEALGRRLLDAGAPQLEATAPEAGAERPVVRFAARLAAGLLAALIALVFAANALGMGNDGRLPPWLARPLRAGGLEQRWEMFSPDVPRLDGWFVMPARLADGRVIDAGFHGPELRWEKPRNIPADFPTARWGVLLMHQLVNQHANGTLRRAYVHFLCRQWNRAHPPEERIERVDVFFMIERSLLPGRSAPVHPRYMASHACPRAGEPREPGWDVTVAEAGAPPPPLVRPPGRARR